MPPAFVTRIATAVAAVIALAGATAAVAFHRASGEETGAPPDAAVAVAAEAGLSELLNGGGAVQLRRQDSYAPPETPHAFYFTRAIYSSGRGWGRRGGSWATDFPKADLQFLTVLRRLARIDAYQRENAITLDDPELRRFPFLYMLEVGRMSLTPEEQKGLRDYLLAGGFLLVDDFWGDDEFANFQYEIQRVLPEYPIEELTLEHPLFSAYYNIDEILQVPSINNARWGSYSECGPCQPFVAGIHDDTGRLMVLINGNTDLGDAWEWAEQPDYPLSHSTYAFQITINFIIYAMSH